MVLHKAYMPRVLVEMGFISNYVEEIYWTQSQVRMKLPLLANAIISYKNEYYGTGVVENLDVRPSQRNAESPAKDSAT
jgi:N-acetylmuramoyl-L-alanine amidase